MSTTRAERLNEAFNYLRFKGLVKTQKDLAEAIGATAPNVSSALKGDEKFLTDSFIAVQKGGYIPLILTTEEARVLVKNSTEREFPNLVVLAASEISSDVKVEALGEIK